MFVQRLLLRNHHMIFVTKVAKPCIQWVGYWRYTHQQHPNGCSIIAFTHTILAFLFFSFIAKNLFHICLVVIPIGWNLLPISNDNRTRWKTVIKSINMVLPRHLFQIFVLNLHYSSYKAERSSKWPTRTSPLPANYELQGNRNMYNRSVLSITCLLPNNTDQRKPLRQSK